MFYKKEQDEQGDYMDEHGTRFSVLCARRIRCAKGLNVGYVEFDSLAAAMQAWGLRNLTPAGGEE